MKTLIFIMIALWFLPSRAISQDFWVELPFPVSDADINLLKQDDNGILYVCLQDNIYYTSDNGANWQSSYDWPGYYPECIAFNSLHHIFIGTFYQGMYRSTDGGESYSAITNGFPYPEINIWNIIVLDDDVLITGTGEGIYRSIDNGDSWEPYGNGLPAGDEIRELSAVEDGEIYAGMLDSGVYKSIDYGANWFASGNGLPEEIHISTLLALAGSNTVYAGIFPDGMYTSYDDGASWAENNQGMPFKITHGLSARDYSLHGLCQSDIFMFVLIYQLAVYFQQTSSDSDPVWIELNDGLPEEPQVAVITSGFSGQLFLGTIGQGLYTNAIPVGTGPESPAYGSCRLGNAPNPFCDRTTFSFDLPDRGEVKIVLTNMTGQVIVQVTDLEYDKGYHQISWDASGLEPGFYLLVLSTQKEIITHKIACKK